MSSMDHQGAIAAYEAAAALDVNDAERTSSYTLGVETARNAMAAAVVAAREKLADGQSAVSRQDWESAIELFAAGLAVEGTHDDDLTSSLRGALESAQASMAARDSARETAEQHFAEGERMLSSRDYPKAIELLEAGLDLDTQSKDLQNRLETSLASAQAGLAAQEAARAEAAEHVSTAEACMGVHDYVGTIAAYNMAATFDVNSDDLMRSYMGGALIGKKALTAALEAARGMLSDGQSAVAALDWAWAIELFTAGIAVEGTNDEKLTASLRSSLKSAEASLAARDAAREKAGEHSTKGESLLEDLLYEGAIDEFKAGLALDTQSKDLRARLQKGLSTAKSGLAAQEAARAEAARQEREAAAAPAPTAEEAEAIRKADELAEARLKGDEEKVQMLEAAEESRQARIADELAEIWKKVDLDGSGSLDSSEIKRVLLRMGRADDIDDVMREVDKNGSTAHARTPTRLHLRLRLQMSLLCRFGRTRWLQPRPGSSSHLSSRTSVLACVMQVETLILRNFASGSRTFQGLTMGIISGSSRGKVSSRCRSSSSTRTLRNSPSGSRATTRLRACAPRCRTRKGTCTTMRACSHTMRTAD